MSLDELQSLFTILAILLAGLWTIFRFGIAREQYPKLQFDLSLNQLGTSRDKQIVELVAVITNKGIIRQYIRNFKFNILVFDDTTPFDMTDTEIEKRLKFKEFSKGLNWDDPDHSAFVDGGMSRTFSYVTALEKDVRFVMIYSKFYHKSKYWLMPRAEQYHISKTFAL